MYPKVQMFIAGEWTDGTSGKSEDILNPATGQPIGKTPHASRADLDRALEAAKAGFEIWRKTSPFDRYKLMRKAADIIRSRADDIAKIMAPMPGSAANAASPPPSRPPAERQLRVAHPAH